MLLHNSLFFRPQKDFFYRGSCTLNEVKYTNLSYSYQQGACCVVVSVALVFFSVFDSLLWRFLLLGFVLLLVVGLVPSSSLCAQVSGYCCNLCMCSYMWSEFYHA